MLNKTRALGSELVNMLLDSGMCKVNTSSNDQSSTLYSACSTGNTKLVSRLLRLGAREVGYPSLPVACEGEHMDVVKLLLRYGSDPNIRIPSFDSDENRNAFKSDTPLCIAANSVHAPIVKMLIQHGASANDKDCFDRTP